MKQAFLIYCWKIGDAYDYFFLLKGIGGNAMNELIP